MVMETIDDEEFREVINRADIVTPDGMPLVWMLRKLGLRATRVYGPDLMLALCAAAADKGVAIGLYGSTPVVLGKLGARLHAAYPGLRVAYLHAPSFTRDEGDTEIPRIKKAGVQLLFVALGCPRQERWIGRYHRDSQTVMVGVGAAFDFLAGVKPQAPSILQRAGLEWAFRLLSEPRRLWRRYAIHNPRFAVKAVRQLLSSSNSRVD